jgi:hypothetical protein
MPLTVAKKLRVQFRKELEKGYVQNAQLDPELSRAVAQLAEANESFVVRVDRVKGGQFWFSDHRVLFEDQSVHELFRYDSVRRCHWMFKNLQDRAEAEPGTDFKRKYGDQLEIDLGDRVCVLDGLAQAYLPIYNFFGWILKPSPAEPAQ